MTRGLFLKMCILGVLNIVHSPQKEKSSVDATQPLDDVWLETWYQIDIVFVHLINHISEKIENLYIEKGNFATRDCPINAYLALGNPVHGDIAQMEASDMVSIDVTFCMEKTNISVATVVSKGGIISYLEQGPISVNQSHQEIRKELQLVLANVSSLIKQSTQIIQEALT